MQAKRADAENQTTSSNQQEKDGVADSSSHLPGLIRVAVLLILKEHVVPAVVSTSR
jgi:hypothetical protein